MGGAMTIYQLPYRTPIEELIAACSDLPVVMLHFCGKASIVALVALVLSDAYSKGRSIETHLTSP